MVKIPIDNQWYDYRLDAMSLYLVKNTLGPENPKELAE
jgi:hypothetical protein